MRGHALSESSDVARLDGAEIEYVASGRTPAVVQSPGGPVRLAPGVLARFGHEAAGDARRPPVTGRSGESPGR